MTAVAMFTVTLQSMVVQEIMETFTFKVKILEIMFHNISMYSSATYVMFSVATCRQNS